MAFVREVLQKLHLGNSVAEFDDALERYFIETDTFRRVITDEVDIVAGDKGTGKTALFRILHKRYTTIDELGDVEVIPAFNISGSSVFQRIHEGGDLDEGQYMTLWKGYLLALAGNWLLGLYDGIFTESMKELDQLLQKTGLRSADESPGTIFSTIVNLFKRLRNAKSVEATASITQEGLPIVVGKVTLGEAGDIEPASYVSHEEALGLLNRALEEVGIGLWLVLDRLDEAFAGLPAREIPALRALLRTYLDLAPFTRIRLKLFLRKDLFRRIIAGGFVNLTHVNARKVEITWDEDSLKHLLHRRVTENAELVSTLGVDGSDADAVFAALFPEQVDPGARKPKTWTWIMGRIRDGNDVKPPRNLIDLAKKAQETQIRRDERESNEYDGSRSLLSPDSLKMGLAALSKQRVEDTLLAEAGAQAPLVEKFRYGKAEHNKESLKAALNLTDPEAGEAIEFLREIGFLEPIGANYKVPMLYRDGLAITQGKAFSSDVPPDEEED